MSARIWILTLLLGLGVTTAGLWAAVHGPQLLAVQAPTQESRVGLGGIEVLVRFSQAHTQAGTFRAILNGADVTDQLKVAKNGAHGSLQGLLEGPNELRLEVFGSGWWPADLHVEERHTLTVLYRPPRQLNQG